MSCFLVHHRSQLAAREERPADLPRLRLRRVGRGRLDPLRKRRFRLEERPGGRTDGPRGGARRTSARPPVRAADPAPWPHDEDERGRPASLAAHRDGRRTEPSDGAFATDGQARRPRRAAAGCEAGWPTSPTGSSTIAPRIPVRDLATLRGQFPGLGPEELADKLVAGAASATAPSARASGRRRCCPSRRPCRPSWPPRSPASPSIEIKLIAELHEVYGLRPPGNLKDAVAGVSDAWSEERGIDVTKPRRSTRPSAAR